jgi:hypothetical protein
VNGTVARVLAVLLDDPRQLAHAVRKRWNLDRLGYGQEHVARELYVQWTQGLVEHHLRTARAPYGPLDSDYCQTSPAELATRLAELPRGLPRISVGRYRGEFQSENPEGEPSIYAHITELGGFLTSGPCELTEITRRFGNGDYLRSSSSCVGIDIGRYSSMSSTHSGGRRGATQRPKSSSA